MKLMKKDIIEYNYTSVHTVIITITEYRSEAYYKTNNSNWIRFSDHMIVLILVLLKLLLQI